MLKKIEPHIPQNPGEAEVIERGMALLASPPSTLAELMQPADDPNHQAILVSHAERCLACKDVDGLLEETEHAWILGGYSEAKAALVMDVAPWEWRMHVIAKGLHVTRNTYRSQIRAEMLYGDEEERHLTHKERMELMRDLDRAEGIGNPTIIKQMIEHKQQILNINASGGEPQGRLQESGRFRELPDEKLAQIMDILDEC